MDTNDIILNLPFDESDGSTITYDYSSNRADGLIYGANFTSGRNGNAIKFKGSDTCEVEKSVISSLNGEFSMLMWVNGGTIECGSPKQLIWLLNFEGFNNYVEVPIAAKPDTWFSLAITKRGAYYNFYVNTSLVKEINNSGSLKGISLNQDFYSGDYGLGLLDDVKFYNVALSQEDLIAELSTSKQQAYLLDGVDFKDYGVFVSESKGVVSKPKLKAMASESWDNYHGEAVDLEHKYYQPREINLSCFIKAGNKNDFIQRVTDFWQQFDKKGTHRLTIDVHPVKPLVYEVYCKDEIDISKKWNEEMMVGTFNLKLIEPEPVKRVLKHMRINDETTTCEVTLSSDKLLNIYWGDGSVDFDVFGQNITIKHTYQTNGDYFVVITGCIDEITSFKTNAIVVWNKL